jgi:hypothetical protein
MHTHAEFIFLVPARCVKIFVASAASFTLCYSGSLPFSDGTKALPCLNARRAQASDFYFQIGSVSVTTTALLFVSYFVWLHHKVQPDIRVDPITRRQT